MQLGGGNFQLDISVAKQLSGTHKNRVFATIINAKIATFITVRKISAAKAKTIITNTINISNRTIDGSRAEQLEDLSQHDPDIICISLINITNFGRMITTNYPITVVPLEIKITAIMNRSENMITPTNITPPDRTCPMRTGNLTAKSTYAILTIPRNIPSNHKPNFPRYLDSFRADFLSISRGSSPRSPRLRRISSSET